MDLNSIKSILDPIGDFFTLALKSIIDFLANIGLSLNDTGTKILGILLIALSIYLIIKFLQLANKVLKYIIIGLLVLLGLSIIFSF